MVVATCRIGLSTFEPDRVTPIEGKWWLRILTNNGVLLDVETGLVIPAPPPRRTAGGRAEFEVPALPQAAIEPIDASYQLRFLSSDERVDVSSRPFTLDSDITGDQVISTIGTPITQTIVDLVLAAVDQVFEARDEAEAFAASINPVNFIHRDSELVGDISLPSRGIECNETHDDSDNWEELLDNIRRFQDSFGPDNNFDVRNVPVLTIPADGNSLVTRQIPIPRATTVPEDVGVAFHLRSPAVGGGSVTYTGAEVRADGQMTKDDNTLTGTGFNADMVNADISVRQAGIGKATLNTYIKSYTDATHVELAHAAGRDIAGAEYVIRSAVFHKISPRSDPRGIPYTFENLVLYGGGISVSNATKPLNLMHVDWHETEGPPVFAMQKPNVVGGDPMTSGSGSVGIYGSYLLFNHCRGGICHQAQTAGLSALDHVRIIGALDTPLLLPSGFYNLNHIDFMGMWEDVGGFLPWMQVFSNAHLDFPDISGRSEWHNLRWGSEVMPLEGGRTHRPPWASIVFGPLGETRVAAGSRPEEITIDGGFWSGGAAEPSETSAKHFAVFNERVEGVRFRDGKIGLHHPDYALFQENWVEGVGGTGGHTRDTVTYTNWLDPTVRITTDYEGKVFSHGGAGWLPQPIAQTRRSEDAETQPRRNLLTRSDVFSNTGSWARTGVAAPTQDVVGPDGQANTGWTLTRTAGGVAGLTQTLLAADFTPGRALNWPIWMKAGTTDISALGVKANIGSDIQELCDNLRPIKLTGDWERYWALCAYVPLGTTSLEISIYHDVPKPLTVWAASQVYAVGTVRYKGLNTYVVTTAGTSAASGGPTGTGTGIVDGTVVWDYEGPAVVSGTILIAKGQLEHGYKPKPYIDTPSGTLRAPLPFQSQVMGRNVRVRTTAALKPSAGSGRWEAGDTWEAADAVLGSISSELCIASGSPGTWVVTGQAGVPHVTTANLQSLAHAINTTDKFKDKRVWNDTTNRPAIARGPLAADLWDSTTGTTSYTPV